MRIKDSSEQGIHLTLPTKVKYIGLFLTTFGVLIPIFLYYSNDSQIIISPGFPSGSLIINSSLIFLLSYLISLQIPSIYYFFSLHNTMTAYGHILLAFLNVIVYIGTKSSIFSFSPILICGIYLLTHFKTIAINKSEETIHFQERIFLLFFVRKKIPFSELKEMVLQYKIGLNFLERASDSHQYGIQLYVLERDPGFEEIPLNLEAEKDSLEFFRPHTLRQTLISNPMLIDSSCINIQGRRKEKLNEIIDTIIKLIGFSNIQEIKKDKKTQIIYRR